MIFLQFWSYELQRVDFFFAVDFGCMHVVDGVSCLDAQNSGFFFCFGVLAEAMISLRNLVKLKGFKLKILEIIENAFKEKQALCP